jgi:TRAP-type C4-dicarboxylate transport system permease small subunit
LKKSINSLSKFQSNAEHWLSLGGGIAVALMMVIGTLDVVLRKIFSFPIPGSYEFVSLTFVIVVILNSVHCTTSFLRGVSFTFLG